MGANKICKTSVFEEVSDDVMDWSDELLLCCVRANFDNEESVNHLRQLLNYKVNWQRTMENLSRHRLSLIFYHFLIAADYLKAVPPSINKRLKQKSYTNAVRSLAQEMALKTILNSFAREAIPAIVLKGLYLDQKIYSCKNVRSSGDIDLFLREEHADRGIDILTNLGYRQMNDGLRIQLLKVYPERLKKAFPTLQFSKQDMIPIHIGLHRLLGCSKRYRATKIEIEDIWAESRLTQFGDMPMYEMRIEHLLIYLCLHLSVQHDFDCLFWTRDLKEVIDGSNENIDWEYIVNCVKNWQVKTYTYFALLFAQRIAAAQVPLSVLNQINPQHFSAKVFEFLLERMGLFHSFWRRPNLIRCLVSVVGDNFINRLLCMISLPFDEFLRFIKRMRISIIVKENLVEFVRKREDKISTARLSD